MMAVLGVVTGFFAGLALGAALLDRPIRRARDPRRAYAALEAAIALWALASIWLLPALGNLLAATLGPAPAPALLWLAGFGLPALALLPATACIGGTLIALERLAGGGNNVAGNNVAGVYGANTAGATAGCLASVFLLIPALGLSGTLAALAALNAICATATLALPRPQVAPAPSPAAKPGLRLCLTLAGTGLLGIALEILVVRLAAQVLQNTVYSFATLLAAYLLGTAIGGLLWQRSRRQPSPAAIAALLTASSAACLLTAALVAGLGPHALAADTAGWGWEFAIAGLLFLLPTAIMGALFGCLAQAFRDRSGSLGGALAINGIGAAVAAPLATLLLIPAVGAVAALPVVGLAFLLFLPLPPRRAAAFAAGPILLAALLLLRPPATLVRIPEGGALLATRDGPTATASVVTDAAGTRYLEVNGHFRMGGTSSRRSDWRQAQIPLLLHRDPHRALFLGVGTGATLAGAAALPGIDATGVELVPEVVHLLPYFGEPNAPSAPPIITADARRFVRADPSRYDVIVADLFHPALDGSGGLYSVEHFAAIRARLALGGIFCQWLPLYQLDDASLHAIMRSFQSVFPQATAWLAHFSLQTPMLALIGAPDGLPLDPSQLERRLADPRAQPALRQTGLQRPLDLLGLYVGGPEVIAALAGPGPRNTDDRPFVAFDARRNVQALAAAPSARLLSLLRRADAVQARRGLPERTAAYLRARDRFIAAGAAIPDGLDERAWMNAAIPGLLDALRLSPDFDPAYWPLLAMAQSLAGPSPGGDADDRAAAIRILRAVQDAAPSRVEPAQLLSRLQ